MFDVGPGATILTVRVICGVGILLFLIASAIILSLIPLYLPGHGSTINYVTSQSQLFYIEYSTTVDNETANYSAVITDLTDATQELNQQLDLSQNTIIIENIQLAQQSNSGSGRRKKRALNYKMLLTSQANYPQSRTFTACRQHFLTDIRQRCSNHSNITFQLRSASATDQPIQFDLIFIEFTFVVPTDFVAMSQGSNVTTPQTLTNMQLVQNCIGQNASKRSVIIDTDADIDDLWAILYLLNVPTINILAITTVGDGFSTPFYSTSNALSFLGLLGCTDRVAVASGLRFSFTSSLPTGWTISDNILSGVDTYLTASTCLNQSTNIFLQPSPFEAVELIVYTLKYSQQPVDILVLGPFTNLAAAIIRDRSIVPKIGTLYISGGQFKSLADYSSLVPNPNLGIYPYLQKPSYTGSNTFLDLLALQRVDDSGIANLVAIPSSVQGQLPANLTQVNLKLNELNITLTPFIYALITSLANCSNQSELAIFWWDNSAAQLMVQLQNNEGLIDFQNTRPNIRGLSNYTICTQTDSDVFLTEFLTKLSSNKFYSCETTYEDRFDLKLQSCLTMYGFD